VKLVTATGGGMETRKIDLFKKLKRDIKMVL
jgi:hypothetical protein